jgi:hypothetical protein
MKYTRIAVSKHRFGKPVRNNVGKTEAKMSLYLNKHTIKV